MYLFTYIGMIIFQRNAHFANIEASEILLEISWLG